jgi:hypothetical protein
MPRSFAEKLRMITDRVLSRRGSSRSTESPTRPSERAAQRKQKNTLAPAATVAQRMLAEAAAITAAGASKASQRETREDRQRAAGSNGLNGESAPARAPYEYMMVEPDDAPSKTQPRFVAQTAGWSWGEGEQTFRANNYPLADWAFFSTWRLTAQAASFDIGQDASIGLDTFDNNGYLDYLIALVPEGADLEKWKEALRRAAIAATKIHEEDLVVWADESGVADDPSVEVAVALWRLKNERWAFGLISAGCDFEEDDLLEILAEEGLAEPELQDPDWIINASEHTLGDDVAEDHSVHPLTREMQEVFNWKKWRHAEAERKILAAATSPSAPATAGVSRRL